MAGYDPILFDLDGTVVDTVDLIRASFRYASRVVLGEELPESVLMANVGQPLMPQMRQLSAEHAQELYDVYREHNHRVHDEMIRSYEGMEAALTGLRAAGRRLGIVTSKSAETTEMAFKAVGLRQFFDVVVTASDTDVHKPSPEPLLLCLRRLEALKPVGTPEPGCATCEALRMASSGAGAAQPIYIGDSPHDIAAGQAAGMHTAAVTWGIFELQDLLAAKPTYVLREPADIVRICLS